MSAPLSKEDFAKGVEEQMDTLYGKYLLAFERGSLDADFPESSEPLKTPEWTPKKSVYTVQDIQMLADELERDAGYEHLVMSVGGVALNLALAYVGAKGL